MKTALTNQAIQLLAPSALAGQAYSGQSDRYQYISSIDVIDRLRDVGFVPVSATQSAARSADKQNFTKHIIRFRHQNDLSFEEKSIGDFIFEGIMTNAHDGSSAYDFSGGVHVIACKNGMTTPNSTLQAVHVRHTGKNLFDRIIEAMHTIFTNAPKIGETIQRWKEIQLTMNEQKVFAKAAFELRFDEESNLYRAIRSEDLLQTRRTADASNSLWHVFNRVQENVVRGGVRGYLPNGDKVRTRSIKGIDQDAKLNKALWILAEGMAAEKA
jgi:hypothetical protein